MHRTSCTYLNLSCPCLPLTNREPEKKIPIDFPPRITLGTVARPVSWRRICAGARAHAHEGQTMRTESHTARDIVRVHVRVCVFGNVSACARVVCVRARERPPVLHACFFASAWPCARVYARMSADSLSSQEPAGRHHCEARHTRQVLSAYMPNHTHPAPVFVPMHKFKKGYINSSSMVWLQTLGDL